MFELQKDVSDSFFKMKMTEIAKGSKTNFKVSNFLFDKRCIDTKHNVLLSVVYAECHTC